MEVTTVTHKELYMFAEKSFRNNLYRMLNSKSQEDCIDILKGIEIILFISEHDYKGAGLRINFAYDKFVKPFINKNSTSLLQYLEESAIWMNYKMHLLNTKGIDSCELINPDKDNYFSDCYQKEIRAIRGEIIDLVMINFEKFLTIMEISRVRP